MAALDIVTRLALRLKVHQVSGAVVHHVALLKKALDQKGITSRMIKGYCVIEDTKEACEHYWLRTEEGLDLDIGFAVARLKNPELMALEPVLLESLPAGLNRSDAEETRILVENRHLFELFESDPKVFWREAPRDVSTFPLK
jgi:hypothetical protein